MEVNYADVAIVGAGIIGSTLATCLSQAGVKTVLIDRFLLSEFVSAAYDGRGSAISNGSKTILEGMGIWKSLAAEAEPILSIRVADGWSPLFLNFDCQDVGKGPLGWIIENGVIRQSLGRVLGDSQVKIFERTEVEKIEFTAEEVILRTGCGPKVTARLAVAADGRQSLLRRLAGIKALEWDYPQTAIVCTVQHELSHLGIAHEHFYSSGPFAILPMTGRRSSIVWTERTAKAVKLMKMDDRQFLNELQLRFGEFLGQIRLQSQRWSYPLSLTHAQSYTGRRVALAGDAAHAIHPIAGQGLNIGIRDIAALAEVIVDNLRLGLDPGQSAALRDYEKWRQHDTQLMVTATDSLNYLFSNNILPLRLMRDLGLGTVNHLKPIKRMLMRRAMGISGKLPRLARGEPL
tara:strand:+ start:519 stop:1730 length:1212 start_codon:yes stop_codon:yes gene_type:complete